MLEFPMQGPVLDEILVHTDWVWRKNFSLEYDKRGYQLWIPWLVLVENRGRLPSIWLDKSRMLEFPMQ